MMTYEGGRKDRYMIAYIDMKTIDVLRKSPGLHEDIYPLEDKEGHQPGRICWCNPEVVYEDRENSNVVWAHRRKH